MKRIIAILSIACAISSCSDKAYLFTSFHEPANEGLRLLYSYDGYHWKDFNHIFLKPEIGKEKVMRDPSMVFGPDSIFHLVWTSSWKGDKGFGYAGSRDLIHWSEEKFIPAMESEPATVNVWAPEIFYDDVAKDYKIIWASTIPGRFESGTEEDSNNHRMFVTTTRNFNKFTPTKLFFAPTFSIIDAAIVKRAPKNYVLLLKDNTRPERNLKVAFGTSPLGPWENISKPFSDHFAEGPTIVKIKKKWLIYYDSYRKKTFEAVATTNFKHFENIDTKISVPENHKHGTIVPVSKKFVKKLLKKVNKMEKVQTENNR